jgi:S-adenosylmethionine decarboxylase
MVKDIFTHFRKQSDGSIYVGNHLILDLWGIQNNDLTENDLIKEFSLACSDAGATVLSEHVHEFGEGCGTTGVIVLAESHLSWHHYPEVNYIAIDIFMCGNADPLKAVPRILDYLKPTRKSKDIICRGILNNPVEYTERMHYNLRRKK